MEKDKKDKDEDKKPQDKTLDIVKRAIGRLVKTKDGQVLFKYLSDLCGFSVSSMVIDPNSMEINTNSTIYNEARKTVYYNIRQLIKKDDLKVIEFLEIKEDADNEV